MVTGQIGAPYIRFISKGLRHTELEANKKAQVGVTYTAMVAKLSCGEWFEEEWQTFKAQLKEKPS